MSGQQLGNAEGLLHMRKPELAHQGIKGVERIENMLSRLNTAAQRLVELAEFIQENGL